MSITVFDTGNSENSTCELNGQFIHSQLLLDVFVRMTPSDSDRNELITLCKQHYSNNKCQLDIINEFEKNYKPRYALWWYTRDSFLYRLLNKALRVQNIDLLFLFRFFIRDLQAELGTLQCSSPISVYRSQLMSIEEVKMLKTLVGHFTSMNSFISTTKDRNVALFLLGGSEVPYYNLERVLFEIKADPQYAGSKYFADITCNSYFQEEEEVLIMFGSIFRIEKVDRDTKGVWSVQLVLCTNSGNELNVIYGHLKKEYGGGDGETDLLCVGTVIRRMGHSDEAEKYFRRLLNQLPRDHNCIRSCYYSLAIVANDRGDYETSLQLHHQSLDIKMRILAPNDPEIAESYNSIGHVYQEKCDYVQAYDFYSKALTIWKQTLGEDHLKVAISFQNIGIVLSKQKKYSKALEYHQKALAIRKKYLPANHPELGDSYDHIADTYHFRDLYDAALTYFEKSLKIFRASLPPSHPSTARTHSRIGYIYKKKQNFPEALIHYEQAASIYSSVLPPTHPKLLDVQKQIQHISLKQKKTVPLPTIDDKNKKKTK